MAIQRRLGWYDLRFAPDARKHERACEECGRQMWLPASKLSDFKRCSQECSLAFRARQVAARTRPCETCGTVFTPRQAQLTNGGGRYCSQGCNTASREALRAPGAQTRARARYAELNAAGAIQRFRGAAHPSWKGGRALVHERRRRSGKAAAELRAYRAKNPHKVREFAERRSRRVAGKLPPGTVERLGSAQRWRCAACRVSVRKAYHLDHITPLARGGEHASRNLQLLCPPCNWSKNAKDPIDFMRERGRLL